MLPLRVEMKGFRTYREKTVLDFEGDWLWAITGKNGSGKSTVFEAMAFALYGEHRGGENHNERVISQGKDDAYVLFDFAIGDDVYQVERTVSRRATRQGDAQYERTYLARRVINRHDPVSIQYLPIAGTERASGMGDWVRRTVGFTYKTFTASILLQQGKADRLILASSSERQNILMEILDLERYKALEATAKDQVKAHSGMLVELEKTLNRVSDVTDEAVRVAHRRVADLEAAIRRSVEDVERATRTMANAQHFDRDNTSLLKALTDLGEAETVIGEASAIECDLAELATLNASLPTFANIVEYRRQATEARAAEADLRRQVETLDVDKLEEAHRHGTAVASAAERAYEQARQIARSARTEVDRLIPLADAGQKIMEIERDIAGVTGEIEAMLPDLVRRDTVVEHEQRCADASRALAPLRSLRQCRAMIVDADLKRAKALIDLPDLEGTAAQIEEEAEAIRRQHQKVVEDANVLGQELAVERARLTTEKKELQARRDAASEGTCSHCGQRVDAEHIEREIAEIAERYATRDQLVGDLEGRTAAIEQIVKELSARAAEKGNAHREAAAAVDEAQRIIDVQIERRDEACRGMQGALVDLPTPYREGVREGEYPTDRVIADVQELAGCLDAAQRESRHLAALQAKAALLGEQNDAKRQQALALQEQHHGVDLLAMPGLYQETLSRREDLGKQENAAWDIWNKVKEEALQASYAVRDAAERRRSLCERVAATESQAMSYEQTASALCKTLALDWRATAASEADALVILQRRQGELAPVVDRKKTLEQAHQRHHTLLADVRRLERSIADIPEDDRIELEQARQHLDEVKRQRDASQNDLSMAMAEATKLCSSLEERTRLEAHRKDVLDKLEDYKLLARYFGRPNLQAWLVQEAQHIIGHTANDYLANISEGMLSLTMEPKGDELNILVTDLSSGQEPMDASSISGSQLFRVAVALALAIGQYSGGGSRDIRAVMIDEGFGGLDKDGRREMIEQLKSLAGVLDRVILVSHQEEFQTAFTNGYHIEKCAGASQVVATNGGM